VILSRAMKEFPSNGAKLQDYEAFIAIRRHRKPDPGCRYLRRSLQSVSRSLTALEAQVASFSSAYHAHGRATEAGLAFHRRINAAFREIRAGRGRALRHIRKRCGARSASRARPSSSAPTSFRPFGLFASTPRA